jgi:SAM-dependent methyltransferase
VGLARGALGLLLEENVRRKFSGRIATLGVQTVYMSPRELQQQFERFSVAPAAQLEKDAKEISDKLLFKMLGFDELESMDYSDFEGADHIVDLNQDGLPEELRQKFDIVLDSGTIEHVFHIPNVMKNVVSLVKVGGRIIFLSPSSNHMDHGFYMFSPTFFADYFLANKFEINTCYVVRYSPNMDDLWDAYEYDTQRWRDLHIGGLDDKPYAIFFVATRTSESTSGVIPQQNYYADTAGFYEGSKKAEGVENKAPAKVATSWSQRQRPFQAEMKSLRRLVGKFLRKFPFAYRLAQRIVIRADKKHLNKRLVGRF